MTEMQIEVDEKYEVVNLNYHDFEIVEFSCSRERLMILLRDNESTNLTEFSIEKPVEYNVTNIFPDSIVGEIFFIGLSDVIADPRLLPFTEHVIGGRLINEEVESFLCNIAKSGEHYLLQVCTIDGGIISVIASRIFGRANSGDAIPI